MSDSKKKIGIFDSGIGGLTVLHALGELLPNEELLYLGDTARVPYGTKSKETVIRYSMENCRFLISHGVKAVVVACNSASATSIPILRESFDLPILGVIEPGVEEAMRSTVTGKIGVIGTNATIESGRYDTLLREHGAKEVVGKACPLFVPLAEEGWTDNKIAEDVARVYLEEFPGKVDTLILGCTHYPLLEKTIAKVCGDEIKLINSASAVAKKLRDTLGSLKLLSDTKGGKRQYFVTDSPARAEKVGGRFLGEDISPHLELTDLTRFA
ncbi:MAG: glutamate racemase [Nitrospinota bacterium]|nr:glutamate racemase [Nitrospinota bacterium]